MEMQPLVEREVELYKTVRPPVKELELRMSDSVQYFMMNYHFLYFNISRQWIFDFLVYILTKHFETCHIFLASHPLGGFGIGLGIGGAIQTPLGNLAFGQGNGVAVGR